MGITIGDAILWIKGDDSQLDKDFQGVEGKTRGWAAGVGDVIKTGLGTAIGFLAAQAIPGLINGLGSFVTEAMAAEETQAQLEAVLKSTGGVAGLTADAVNDLATSLSEVTRFEDDAIVAGENMLLTFTNIGKDVFPAATETMLDMSQALGQDMKSSAIQLGKALNDPITGVTALQRVGVSFTEEQKKQIETMVEAGDVMGAHQLILAELNKEFGGSAKAAGATFAGTMDRLKNAVGNVKESIGEQLIPVLTDFVSNNVLPFVQKYGPKLAEWLGKNLPVAVARLTEFWTTTLQPALTQVWSWMQTSLFPVLKILFDWLAMYLPPAIAALADFWTNTLQPALTQVWSWLEANLFPTLAVLWAWLQVNVPQALETLRKFWVETAWPAIQQAIETVWPIIEDIFNSLKDFIINTLIPTVQDLYEKWTTEWWPTIQTVLENVWTIIEEIFGEIGRWVNDNIIPWVEYLKQVWSDTVWPAIQKAVEDVWLIIGPIWESLRAWLEEKLPPALSGLQTIFESVMKAIDNAIQPVKTLWDNFVLAIKNFWSWITGKEFKINVKLPDLPQWVRDLLPGGGGVGGGGGGGSGGSTGSGGTIPRNIPESWGNFADEMDMIGGQLEKTLSNLGANPSGTPALQPITITVPLMVYGGQPELVRKAANDGVLAALRAKGL